LCVVLWWFGRVLGVLYLSLLFVASYGWVVGCVGCVAGVCYGLCMGVLWGLPVTLFGFV